MSLGLILIIILVIFLLGGFSGRFGGYGYGFGHGGVGVIGIIVIILVVLMLLGRIWSASVCRAEHAQNQADYPPDENAAVSRLTIPMPA
jgi:uncharacterized membrane protein